MGRERDPGGPPLGGLSGSGGVTDWLPGSSQPSTRPAWPSLPSSLEGLCELPTPPPASELELGGCRDNLVPPGTVLPCDRDPASGERGSRPGPGPSLEGTVDKGRESSGCSLPLKRSFKIRKPKPVPQDCIVQAGGEVAIAADRSTGWRITASALTLVSALRSWPPGLEGKRLSNGVSLDSQKIRNALFLVNVVTRHLVGSFCDGAKETGVVEV